MRLLLSVVLFFCSSFFLNGQIPQYTMTPTGPTLYSNYVFNRPWDSNRIQFLYYPALEFPTVPTGLINNIYFKAGRKITTPLTYKGFYIGMVQYTNENDSMSLSGSPPLSWYATDTLLSADYTFQPPIDSGDWVKIPLQRLFKYDPNKNFILDIFHYGNSYYPNGLTVKAATITGGGAQSYVGDGNKFSTPSLSGAAKFVFGFDLIPLSVHQPENLVSLKLYPNPSEGKFTITFSAQNKINETMITVTNLMGGTILQEGFQNIIGSFSKKVDMTNMAKGVYFVGVKADGQRVVRKVVVE
jgi:hypothetical protein